VHSQLKQVITNEIRSKVPVEPTLDASDHTDLSWVVGSFEGDSKKEIKSKKNHKTRKKMETKVSKDKKVNKKNRRKKKVECSLGAHQRRSKSAPGNLLNGRSITYKKHVKKKETKIRTGRRRPKPPFQGK